MQSTKAKHITNDTFQIIMKEPWKSRFIFTPDSDIWRLLYLTSSKKTILQSSKKEEGKEKNILLTCGLLISLATVILSTCKVGYACIRVHKHFEKLPNVHARNIDCLENLYLQYIKYIAKCTCRAFPKCPGTFFSVNFPRAIQQSVIRGLTFSSHNLETRVTA